VKKRSSQNERKGQGYEKTENQEINNKSLDNKGSFSLRKTIGRLVRNAARADRPIIVSFGIYTLMAAAFPFCAVVLPKFVLEELTKQEAASATRLLSIIGIFFLTSAILGFGKTYLHDVYYARLSALRINYIGDMYNKLISLEYRYMEDATFYDRNSRAMEANSSNNNGVEGVYHKLYETPAVVLTALVYMVLVGILNPILLLGLLVNTAVIILIGKKAQDYQYSKKDELGHLNRRKTYYYKTTYDFAYGKDIRLYGLKQRILDNYNKEIKGYVGVQKLIAQKEYLYGFLGLVTLLLSDGLTYGILIYKTATGMSIADFSMYLAMIVGLSLLMKTISDDFSFLWRESQYVNDFFEFMDHDFSEQSGSLPAIEGDTLEIEFKNVTFRYPGTEKDIFTNLNFTIHKGERLAIVGINGAGKSTLVKLMTGLFKPTVGHIYINGIDSKEFSQQAMFSMFSVVFQDVNVLAFSIEENVACRSVNIDQNRVQDALEKVGLWEKVSRFEKGTKQPMLKVIEEDGTEFSGGEKQKLAIARALYEDGNMIVMDEPTAALDALAEAEIYENFSSLVKGKTAVYISHRLASTKFCDKIALFSNDGLLEYGNHDELMNKKGEYYNMFTVQGKYYQEQDEDEEASA